MAIKGQGKTEVKKLNEIPIDEVDKLHRAGWLLKNIARRYNVHAVSLGQLCKHKGIVLRNNRYYFRTHSPTFCPKCTSDDIDIIFESKKRWHISCDGCGKGSYIKR